MRNICYYISINPKHYYKLGIESLTKYCNKHNIDLKEWNTIDSKYRISSYNTQNNIWYQKIATIDDFIKSEYDNYMLVDVDMLFNSDAPNVFDLIEDDFVYQQYAPNTMIDINHEFEVGNGGLFLFNKNVAKSLLPELQSDKIDIKYSADQLNFAKARVRAGIPFKKVEDKWNYTFWSLPKENVVNDLVNDKIYFLHYGNSNISNMDKHLGNQQFKNKVL